MVVEDDIRRVRSRGSPGYGVIWCFAVMIVWIFAGERACAEGRTGAISFERNDRLLTWQNTNSGMFALKPKLRVGFENALSTSLSMTTGSSLPDRWYDRVYTNAKIDYDFTERLGLSVVMKEEWNKDTMSRLGNSFLTADYGGRLTWRPLAGLDMAGSVGRVHDRRYENRDDGTTASGDVRYRGTPLASIPSFSTELDVGGGTSTLRRANDSARIRSAVVWVSPFANMRMEYSGNRAVRGYFAESKSNAGITERKDIEERTNIDQGMSVTLSRGVFGTAGGTIPVEIKMGLGGTRITDTANDKDPMSPKYHTNARGKVRDAAMRTGIPMGRFVRSEWEMAYSKNENDVQRAIRSRTQTDVSTRGSFDIMLSPADSLNLIGWIKRSRIDTPEVVHNDRDELKIEGGTHYMRRWGDTFNTGLDFRLLETHYVNIDITQSSQNKWLKTYQLAPSFLFEPSSSFRIRHEAGLQADYIDFDFDSKSAPRSTITRRVSSETWVKGTFFPGTEMNAGFMLERNDYGKLSDRGGRIPVEDGIRRFLDLSLRYEFTRWIILVPQYVYAIRKDRSIERRTIERREIDQTYGMDLRLFENARGDGHDCVIGVKRIVRRTLREAPQVRNYITMTFTYGF